MTEVFLDANVLFSASYTTTNRFLRLWHIAGISCVTSLAVVSEVERNLQRAGHLDRLQHLLRSTRIVGPEREAALPPELYIAAKDIHVLASAIGAHCRFLLTGDKNHFATHFNKTIEGVTVMLPAEFLDRYPHM